MSCAGMPSVIEQTSLMPASAASMIASAAKAGATKVMLVVAPVFLTASFTVLNTGTPQCVWPPLPGVTPATTLLPPAIISFVWKVAFSLVMPCTSIGVFSSIRMLMARTFWCSSNYATRNSHSMSAGNLDADAVAAASGDSLARCLSQCVRADDRNAAFLDDLAAGLDIGTGEANDQGHADPGFLAGLNDTLRYPVATVDAGENIDEHALHLLVRQHQPECGRDPFRR